jgi:hypothetical protein
MTVRAANICVACIAFCLSAAAFGAAPAQAPASMFDFHSGFWMNLHHFIYATASSSVPQANAGPTLRINQSDADAVKRLSPSEQAVWQSSVTYYAANYIQRDLGFDDLMYDIKMKLESAEASPDLKGTDIPAELKSILLEAAPIYRKYWWRRHDTQNKRWVAQVRPLLSRDGLRVRQSLETVYSTAWPTQPLRVETVAYANWAGAYTTVHPATQPTISTTHQGNQGTAALEMIFHESSHGLVDKLQDAIKEATSTLPPDKQKVISRTLWHAVLFYTTGELVAEHHPGYEPYADQAGLWVRAWPEPIRSLIIQDWKPHMQGSATFNSAVTALVSDLASSN